MTYLLRAWRLRAAGGASLALIATLLSTLVASANYTVIPISSDPYTNAGSQHATQVEPDSFSYGATTVAVFQVGRYNTGGGSSNIGWATSKNNGRNWVQGFLPGITVNAGGPNPRASDPTVAYDAKHGTWLASFLFIDDNGDAGFGVSRSTDGGLTWQNPVQVAAASPDYDKDWVVCDNTSTSPYYGNCYIVWDDAGIDDNMLIARSSNGGQTWTTSGSGTGATGLGGQPLVQPNGKLVIPFLSFNSQIQAFNSSDGGVSFGGLVTIANLVERETAGNLRSEALPSAEIDRAGKIYLVWQDCRFRAACAANDIVLSVSTDGLNWSGVKRIPLDPVTSTVDHFIPGIGVDRTTSGRVTRLALTYYYYPAANCNSATCQLYVGFAGSNDGGDSWTPSRQIAGPMNLAWLPQTSLGRMVGDYISSSFTEYGKPQAVFSLAGPPSGNTFDQHASVLGGLETALLLAPPKGQHFVSVANDPVLTVPTLKNTPPVKHGPRW